MLSHVKKIERVKAIASRLGDGWVYHAVLSEDSRYYFLSDRKGLYIQIGTVYGQNIEQWSLSIKNENYHGHFHSVCTIGCNLEKSLNAIITDIKSRLFSYKSEAYNKLKEYNETLLKKNSLSSQRKMIVESIKKVVPIEKNKNHGYESYKILDSEDYKIGSFEHTHDRLDSFSLHLQGVTAENIIKIMALITR